MHDECAACVAVGIDQGMVAARGRGTSARTKKEMERTISSRPSLLAPWLLSSPVCVQRMTDKYWMEDGEQWSLASHRMSVQIKEGS